MFRTIKNLYRLICIMRTLARYDAVFPLEKLDLPDWAVRGLSFLAGRASKKYADHRPGERLAMALQEQGPSFIKFGQSLSTRSDLIGEEAAQE